MSARWGLLVGSVAIAVVLLYSRSEASERASTLASNVVEIASTRERLAAQAFGFGLPTSTDYLADAERRAEEMRPALVGELGEGAGAELDRMVSALRSTAELQTGVDLTDPAAVAKLAGPYVQASIVMSGSANALVGELSARGAEAARLSRLVIVLGGALIVAGGGSAFFLLGRSQRRAQVMAARFERAEEVERLKSEFIGLASHELRTPLTGMIGFTQLLLEKPGFADDARSWVEHIHTESVRLNEVVDQLLLAGELDSQMLGIEVVPVDLATVVDAAIESTATRAMADPVFERSGASDVSVLADRQRLVLVVASLLSNAVKYGAAGEPVHVEWSVRASEVVLSVRDHGAGLSADQAARLFDRFGRADTSDARQVRGLGMGLHVAKRLIESMGGSISASADGAGAVFTLRLTAAEVPARHAA